MKKNQIAIDGPAGAGKSTIAKMIAAELGWIYVDTGAMYRAMALYFDKIGTDVNDEAAIDREVDGAAVELAIESGTQVVRLNGEDVSKTIREQRIGELASWTSRYGSVRAKLTELQRVMAEEQPVIMDGRDIGTTVLPDAGLKIYLTASTAVRAKRRYDELVEKGVQDADLSEIEKEIAARDEQDMNREISPLRKADDAIEVDTSDMTIDEVVARVIAFYHERVL
ncbi:MAG: (d)CMP kinase [Eubacterium sp.]|nr:(d)CMP kinase [Eubacterium sp.]